jgi:protein-glutamine gamma-glutamyltransferase
LEEVGERAMNPLSATVDRVGRPLVWTIRCAAALGFASLSLTGEISQAFLIPSWTAWTLSFGLDRHPDWEDRLRTWETAAVILLVSVFLLDFFVWGHDIFVSVAHFLILFQIFKLLGNKSRKDCLQILMFSFFQLLSACTLSVDAWQAFIFLLLIPVATAGLFWQQISREAEESGQAMPESAAKPYRRWVAVMCLSAIPMNFVLASILFMLFPRLAFRGAFAGLGAGRSGYTEQVNLSQTGTLGTDNSAVLWLQIQPENDRSRWQGYLRGSTLDVFDGQRWSRSRSTVTQTIYADRSGIFRFVGQQMRSRPLRQSITLVNTAGATIFGSPFIAEVNAPLATLQVMGDSSVRWITGWRKPLRYDVVSYESQGHKGPPSPNYLQLPEISLDRTQELTRQISARTSGIAQARAIEDHLRTQYTYSLDFGDRAPANPVEDFLFNRQKGACGHFASAMAVMLRLQGIPSRVVAGYYKGVWNSRVGQYLMRERDAHAWVEAYFPNTGWVAFDPSPRADPSAAGQLWRVRAQEMWGYLNYHWDRLVIEYDLYSQVKVAEDIQSNTRKVNAMIGGWTDKYLMGWKKNNSELSTPNSAGKTNVYLIGAAGLLLIGGMLGWGLRKRKPPVDRSIAFYQKFLDEMARKGFPKSSSETGWEYAERLRSQTHADPAQAITQRYYLTRFASSPLKQL